MRRSDGGATGKARLAVTRVTILLAALALAACGSDTPPPLTGNLVDARGAHAGSFRGANASSGIGNATRATPPANSQDAAR